MVCDCCIAKYQKFSTCGRLLMALQVIFFGDLKYCVNYNPAGVWQTEKMLILEMVIFKSCVCYLHRCTTSPTYILYQLNEKNELTITYHILFYLNQYHLWKRWLLAICILSASHAVFMKFSVGKLRQASFQTVWCIGMPKQILVQKSN